MTDDDTTKPAPKRYPGIPETFEEWWERYGEADQDYLLSKEREPWTRDPEERRALWERRHTRPAPPEHLHRDPRPKSYIEETPA